jgi:hypothetical protein
MRSTPGIALACVLAWLALPAAGWELSQPTAIDLRMPASLFDAVPLELGEVHFDPEFARRNLPEGVGPVRERLARSRPRTCHTQGLAISDQHVFVSCSFYAEPLKRIRAYAARSLLLRAPRKDLLEGEGEVRWELSDLTENHEDGRFQPPVTRVLGHPSGLILDPEGKGLWVATAVYDPDTYAFLHLLGWDGAAPPVARRQPLPVEDHVGTVGLFLGGGLAMGIAWGAGIHLFDLATGRARSLESGLEVDYQDCDVWAKREILCAGYHTSRLKDADGEWQVQTGHLDVLALEGEGFETYRVRKARGIPARGINGSPLPALELGQRRFRDQEGKGDIEAVLNRYGDYETYLPLTNNGMSLSPDRRQVYLLPDDLPGARLLRFELSDAD